MSTDPRPIVGGEPPRLSGGRCTDCGRASIAADVSCVACGGRTRAEQFGPDGVVYSSTVVRIKVGERQPGYSLAYVDLIDGPRVLAHVADGPVAVGADVRLTPSRDGDVTVEVLA